MNPNHDDHGRFSAGGSGGSSAHEHVPSGRAVRADNAAVDRAAVASRQAEVARNIDQVRSRVESRARAAREGVTSHHDLVPNVRMAARAERFNLGIGRAPSAARQRDGR